MEPQILLVEDDERIRQALRLALADEGCQVVEARSGEEALELLTSATVDLVLLDLMLSGPSGTEVCRSLRQRSDVPVIMLSARDSEVDKAVSLELGADDYVTKPFSWRELAERIRAVLERDRLVQGSRDQMPAGQVHGGLLSINPLGCG